MPFGPINTTRMEMTEKGMRVKRRMEEIQDDRELPMGRYEQEEKDWIEEELKEEKEKKMEEEYTLDGDILLPLPIIEIYWNN
uniref:Uncharacterized protein n=1 Tax=Pristionchus pacificus TaxID=54126 RepID=A0A2A6B8F4_PRIPA|eukprot:PDM62162.1 hypothetical protein PRIPAC_51604 [Pristionchus pacificus]